jgi:hypothetical protein
MATRGGAAWCGGWLWKEVGGGASKRSPRPEPAPNKGLELTASSLRFAAASGSSSGLALCGEIFPATYSISTDGG